MKKPTQTLAAGGKTSNAALTNDEVQQADLVGRMLSSKIIGDEDLKNLLIFLADNRSRIIHSADIVRELFKQEVEANLASAARGLILKLRANLSDYQKRFPNEPWICELPKMSRGYQISFTLAAIKHSTSPTRAIWKPHAVYESSVLVACGSHLFFHDPETKSAFRIYDFNHDVAAEETLKLLKATHQSRYKPSLVPWYHSYLSNGEVSAYETISDWFHAHAQLRPRRYQSREIAFTQILRASPILLGRPETNSHIKSLMSSPSAAKLGFRIHDQLGAIAIDSLKAEERRLLRRFPLSKDGVLGPMPSSEMVFGLVSRFPNLGGHGPVTIISADSHAKAVSKIAEALTTESKAKVILDQTGWDWQGGLPECFEMLFAVSISSPDLQGEGEAELILSRF